jgi:2-iminobutanoate/2-iminopropanoate deaminase
MTSSHSTSAPSSTDNNPSDSSRRPRSIEVEGVSHGNAPIPMGARVGNMLFSSGIMGKDPATDTLPPDASTQARFVFVNLRTLLANGGAALQDVAHVKALDKGGSNKNGVRIQSASKNRSFKRDSKGNLVSEVSKKERKKR